MGDKTASHTAPISPDGALCLCAEVFPRLEWRLANDKPRGPRHCRGESSTLLVTARYDPYGGWTVCVTVRLLRATVQGEPFGVIVDGGPSLAHALVRVLSSLATWVDTIASELGGEA